MPNTSPVHALNQEPHFACAVCKGPLAARDLNEIGLRTPDFGETTREHCDAELLDPRELRHVACLTQESQQAS